MPRISENDVENPSFKTVQADQKYWIYDALLVMKKDIIWSEGNQQRLTRFWEEF